MVRTPLGVHRIGLRRGSGRALRMGRWDGALRELERIFAGFLDRKFTEFRGRTAFVLKVLETDGLWCLSWVRKSFGNEK